MMSRKLAMLVIMVLGIWMIAFVYLGFSITGQPWYAMASSKVSADPNRGNPYLNSAIPLFASRSMRPSREALCRLLPYPIPRTQDLWMSHLPQLLEYSVHPYDKERNFVDLSAQLLYLMSPQRFQRSVRALPHRQWSSVQSALNVTMERMAALQRNDTTSNSRPLEILVMGGSVAEGDRCNPRTKAAELQQRRRACAWPFRLQFMLDRILGHGVAHVNVATVGGTNSESALVLLEYDLVPREIDVIIHAYSTNDMHAYTLESATSRNLTLRERVFDLTEQFARRALGRCRPSGATPPLLLHLDDYLGNEQNNIFESTVMAQTIPLLANYYGFHSISFADSIRDLVYGYIHETFLTPFWKVMNESTGVLFREVHPGMGFHITIAFMILYNFAEIATTFCAMPEHELDSTRWRRTGNPQNIGELEYHPIANLPPLNQSFKLSRYYKIPYQPPKGLPPSILPNLTLDSITQQWKQAIPVDKCKIEYENRCIFAWYSRITANCMLPGHLDGIIAEYAIENHGWIAEMEFKKLGLVPVAGNQSRLTLEFKNLSQPVSSVMISVMKSYGPKWKDSKIRLSAAIPKRRRIWIPYSLSLTEITGYHGKNTSEQYSYTTYLEGPTLRNLRLTIELASGNASKIMGMAVCS